METRQVVSDNIRSSYRFSVNEIRNLKQVGLLGAGAYGVVILAKNMSSYNQVALKIMTAIAVNDKKKTSLEAYQNEIDIMITLTENKAPNTVAIHGYFLDTFNYYIAMPYIAHGTLEKRLKATTDEQQHRIMYGMANALAHMHEYDIVHCDIKPANVLLDTNFEPHLCDFGYSKRIEDNNGDNAVGTPLYMPPELLLGQSGNSKSSDVYSLSVTYWQIAERNSNPFAQIKKYPAFVDWVARNGNREVISEHCKPSVAKLITWGWAQNSNERPTAQEVRTALADINESEKICLK